MKKLKFVLIPLLVLLLPVIQAKASVRVDGGSTTQLKEKKRLDLSTLRLNRFENNGKAFKFLIHGSHRSHGSHASHSSHVSSSSGSSYGGRTSSSNTPSLSPAEASSAVDTSFVVVIKKANLRSGPDVRYAIIATVDVGLIATLIEEKDGWTHVSYEQEAIIYDGWVSSEMLKIKGK
jgi:hypothetical protein